MSPVQHAIILSFLFIPYVNASLLGDIWHTIGFEVGQSVDGLLALPVTVLFITLGQLSRLKFKPSPPEGFSPSSTSPVGNHFTCFLSCYLLSILLLNILQIVSGSSDSIVQPSFDSGLMFLSQMADTLFFAMLFSVIAYRRGVLLDPETEKVDKLKSKSYLEGSLLIVLFSLGIARDIVYAQTSDTEESFNTDATFNTNTTFLALNMAYQALVLVASLDVAISVLTTFKRMKQKGIEDDCRIIWKMTYRITPLVLIGSIYRVVEGGLVFNSDSARFALAVVGLILGSALPAAVAAVCVEMYRSGWFIATVRTDADV